MLNLVTPALPEQRLLESSFEAIRMKDQLSIVMDEQEKVQVQNQTVNALRMPNGGMFSFQNLFKIAARNGSFYIAQCIISYPSPIGNKGSQTFSAKYSFHTMGIANMKHDLGITNLRPETKIDKLLGIVFKNDIDFDGTERFNEKYYLASDHRKKVEEVFNRNFLEAIGRHDDILLSTKNHELYISFVNELISQQARAVEDILSSCNFLAG